MLTSPDLGEVLRLAGRLPGPPGETLVGAPGATLKRFELRTGLRLPPQLYQWLHAVNGATRGPGGLFGVRDRRDFLSIEGMFEIHPHWVEIGWIPIAADGVGNYWVTASGPDGADGWVAFVNTHEDPYILERYAASSVLRFLEFLFRSELGERGWPEDREYVVSRDAAMAMIPDALAPWR